MEIEKENEFQIINKLSLTWWGLVVTTKKAQMGHLSVGHVSVGTCISWDMYQMGHVSDET